MRRSRLTLSLGMLVLVIGALGLLVFLVLATTDSREQGQSAGVAQINSAPMTAGVILVDPADAFGWGSVAAAGAHYTETMINGSRVFVFDALNPTDRPGVTLELIVSGMLERGVHTIFVSPGYLSQQDEVRIAERYPDTVFIMNLATRADVERVLSVLPATDSISGQGAIPQTVPSATSAPASEENSTVMPSIVMVLALTFFGVTMSLWWKKRSFAPARGKSKRRVSSGMHARALAIEQAARSRASDFGAVGESSPVVHKLSTYVLGDKHFDESFSVELPSGTFLGECGMGIAAPVNRYDREKVAAFEVWLFDKNDIRTASAVLGSERGFRDSALRKKLQTKGELVQALPDAVVTLETQTLRLRARVLDVQYGFSDTLPRNSFFEHIVVEVAVWQKTA